VGGGGRGVALWDLLRGVGRLREGGSRNTENGRPSQITQKGAALDRTSLGAQEKGGKMHGGASGCKKFRKNFFVKNSVGSSKWENAQTGGTNANQRDTKHLNKLAKRQSGESKQKGFTVREHAERSRQRFYRDERI